MFHRIRHMIVKEFLQLRRDRAARIRLLVPPIVQMLVYGYAATFEVHRVTTAVLDLDQSQESRDLLSRFTSNGRFEVRAVLHDRDEIVPTIDRERATLVLQIRAGFAELLRKGQTAPLQVVLDGTNSNTALIALGYINRIASQFVEDYQRDRLRRLRPELLYVLPEVRLAERPWYNPDLNSRWFFVPGVVGSLALVIVANLTAFAVVREREMGTLEQIMVTPISRFEFILGKTVPSFMVGLGDTGLIALVGTLWFGVPFRGSLLALMLGAALFVMSTLGIGLLISTVSATTQEAFMTMFMFFLPAMIFSGFFFPIANMPAAFRLVSFLDPLRYYLETVRGIFLKGAGATVLWPQIAALAVMGGTILWIASTRFRKTSA
ncbi:MAG TPA: ABC transporter permease [Deltaproteobacteria bacterium]|nr:ABC transporter permease [Deltaproteobacteria bacterium]